MKEDMAMAKTAIEEVQEFLKSAQTFYLATIDGNRPRVRPFGTAEIFEGKLYIQTGKKKDVFKQIEKNPEVELCAFKDGRWLRVAGRLVHDDRREPEEDMLDKNPGLKKMYAAGDGNTAVLYFEKAEATFSSFTEPPRTVVF